MNASFFQKAFLECEIEVITPNEDEKNYIGTKIKTELEFGKIIPNTQYEFQKIVERIVAEVKVQAIVLGCTELPLIFLRNQTIGSVYRCNASTY